MRLFTEIEKDWQVWEFLDVPEGTLYFSDAAAGRPNVIVRHFDGTLPATQVSDFADITRAAQAWLERHAPLSRLVRVEQPFEVGKDYVARPHHVYYTSTSSYVLDEDPPDPPEELAELRERFRTVAAGASTPQDKLLVSLLSRSIVEPSGKTFFKGREGRFVIVELKLTPEDLAEWRSLSG